MVIFPLAPDQTIAQMWPMRYNLPKSHNSITHQFFTRIIKFVVILINPKQCITDYKSQLMITMKISVHNRYLELLSRTPGSPPHERSSVHSPAVRCRSSDPCVLRPGVWSWWHRPVWSVRRQEHLIISTTQSLIMIHSDLTYLIPSAFALTDLAMLYKYLY